MGLKDKICIITGGGSGIGLASAEIMAAEGATIILVGRTLAKVDEARDNIREAGGTAESYSVDVADQAGVGDMVQKVLDQYGRIDVLINNAGHSSYHRKVETTTPDEIQAVVNSNLVGTIYCTQAVLPAMKEAKEGTIINVASMAGVTPGLLGGMIYSAVKAAVINFTGFLNTELKNTGIRSSVVIPGEIDTPILDNRPIPPSRENRDTMATAEDTGEAIALIARLPLRANIPQLIIRPTYQRDSSGEVSQFP